MAKNVQFPDGIFPGARSKMLKIPVFLIVPIVYVIFGKLTHIWHPTWIIFFFIPIYYDLCGAVGAKTKRGFLLALPIPLVIVAAFLTIGLTIGLWKYTWIMFLFIPIYYWWAGVMNK